MRYFFPFLSFIFFIFSLFSLSSCSTSVDPADLYKNQSASQIFQDGETDLNKGHFDSAVKHFEALESRYPFSEHAEQAQLDLIYAYYKMDNSALALASADRFIRMYPRGTHVDYAYYLRGLVQFEENRGFFEKYFKTDFAKRDLSGLHKAYNDFDMLIQYFPKSAYAYDARQRMVYIRNVFARHVLLIGEFYFKRKSYVAAANRANEVIRHYQETDVVPQAFELLIKSYRKLGLTEQADSALQVYEKNFPNRKI